MSLWEDMAKPEDYKPKLTLFDKARNVLTKVILTLVDAKVKVEFNNFRSMSDENKMHILRTTIGALEKQNMYARASHSMQKLLGSRSNANTLYSNRGKKGIETYYTILNASIYNEMKHMLALSSEKFENCNSRKGSSWCSEPKKMTIYYIHNGSNQFNNTKDRTPASRDLNMENAFDTTGYKNFQITLISWLDHLKITHRGKYKDLSETIDRIIEIISDSESERYKKLQEYTKQEDGKLVITNYFLPEEPEEEGDSSRRAARGGTRRRTLRRKRKAGRTHRN